MPSLHLADKTATFCFQQIGYKIKIIQWQTGDIIFMVQKAVNIKGFRFLATFIYLV